MLDKSHFKAFHEAVPRCMWYCEFPYCTVNFIMPSLSLDFTLPASILPQSGRHHCRVCGISVCEAHCAKNITLSTHILTPYTGGNLNEITTPILAASPDVSTLPAVLTFKWACLLCCDRAHAFNQIGAFCLYLLTAIPNNVIFILLSD